MDCLKKYKDEKLKKHMKFSKNMCVYYLEFKLIFTNYPVAHFLELNEKNTCFLPL